MPVTVRTQGQPNWALIQQDPAFSSYQYVLIPLDGTDPQHNVMRVWSNIKQNFTGGWVDYGYIRNDTVDGLQVPTYIQTTPERSMLPAEAGLIRNGTIGLPQGFIDVLNTGVQLVPPDLQSALDRQGVQVAQVGDVNKLPSLTEIDTRHIPSYLSA